MPRKVPLEIKDCFFNSCVMCDNTSKCATCGWNPEVDKRRRARLRAKGSEIVGKAKKRSINGKKNS